MLRRGDEECTSEKPVEPDLFDDPAKESPTFEGSPSGAGDGVVKTNKAKNSESAETEVVNGEQEPVEEEKPKKPSAFSRMGKWIRETAGKLVEES